MTTKSKTPIADALEKEKNNHWNWLKILEYTRDLETKLHNAKEESPTKAVEVLKSLEEIIQIRIKDYERSIIENKIKQLDLEQEKKSIERDKIHTKLCKDHEATINGLKRDSEKEYKELERGYKTLVRDYEDLKKKINYSDAEVLLKYIDILRNRDQSFSLKRGQGMFKKETKIRSSDVVKAFQYLLSNISDLPMERVDY